MHDSLYFDPYLEKVDSVLEKEVRRSTLQGESIKDELRQILEQAPDVNALGSALLRCQREIDAAFSLEAALEFQLPLSHWEKYLTMLLRRDPSGVLAAFGQGLLALPEAQEMVFYAGTHVIPESIGQYLSFSQLAKDRERKVIDWWAREYPLIFSQTEARYLDEKYGKTQVTTWVNTASTALKHIQTESSQRVVALGAIACTRKLSDYLPLREPLVALRARGYDAALQERLPQKDQLTMNLDLASNENDVEALKSVQDWVRSLAYEKGVMEAFTPSERYMVGTMALLRWSTVNERPAHFMSEFQLKDRLSEMDSRILVEETLTAGAQKREEPEIRLLGALRDIPHTFLDPAKDVEDQTWTQGIMEHLFRHRSTGTHQANSWLEAARLNEILQIGLARNVEVPERVWKRALKIAPDLLLRPWHDGTFPIHRYSRTRQEQAMHAWMSSIEKVIKDGGRMDCTRSLLDVRRIIVSSKLLSSQKGFLRTDVIKIMRAAFREGITDNDAWALFCSLDKWFPQGHIHSDAFLESDGLKLLHAFLREPTSEVSRFISTVGKPAYLAGIPPRRILERWHRLGESQECKHLLQFDALATHYLQTGTDLDRHIKTAEEWQNFAREKATQAAQRKLTFFQSTVDRRSKTFVSAKEEWVKWRASVPSLVSFARGDSPEKALQFVQEYHLDKYPKELFLRADDIEEVLLFIERYDGRLRGIKDRLNYALKENVLQKIFLAKDRLEALRGVEALLDEFDTPGTEAVRLASFMMHLFSDATGSDTQALAKTKFFSEGELILGRDISFGELCKRFAERLEQVLNPSQEERLLAFHRNRELFDGADSAGPILPEGTLIHWTTPENIAGILEQGNLCGESLGESVKTDSFPLHVDTLSIAADEANQTLANIMKDDRFQYGELPIALVYPYRQRKDAFARGEEYLAESTIFSHRLIFGGLPKTEVGLVVIKKEALTEDLLTRMKQFIVDGGVYVPLFLSTGEALFSPEEFAERYLRDRPYGTVQQFLEDHSWMDGLDVDQNSTHEHTLKEHLLLAERYAREYAELFRLDAAAARTVIVAARLHDVGKIDTGPQALTNVAAADRLLKQIRHLSREEARSIRRLIHHDELLGSILMEISDQDGGLHLSTRGQDQFQRFQKIFPTEHDKHMLLSVYLADVRAIGNGKFDEWQVEKKLRWLGLFPASSNA